MPTFFKETKIAMGVCYQYVQRLCEIASVMQNILSSANVLEHLTFMN